jgi:hypothetical protein
MLSALWLTWWLAQRWRPRRRLLPVRAIWSTDRCKYPEEVRRQAAVYARAAGPVMGDVWFSPAWFQNYLESLCP